VNVTPSSPATSFDHYLHSYHRPYLDHVHRSRSFTTFHLCLSASPFAEDYSEDFPISQDLRSGHLYSSSYNLAEAKFLRNKVLLMSTAQAESRQPASNQVTRRNGHRNLGVVNSLVNTYHQSFGAHGNQISIPKPIRASKSRRQVWTRTMVIKWQDNE